ncbi:MAG: tRNA pseudouridine(55) synthase TruB, partial [Bacteroidetes bacterium GWA2_30_7]
MTNVFLEGTTLLFNKPLAWTSADITRKVHSVLKRHYQIKKIKVGHAGTLDPMATGLVIVCTGMHTKTIDSIQSQEKEYIAVLKLGETTPSFDLETNVDFQFEISHINEDFINQVLKGFVGKQKQIPPQYSAKRIDGKRAYEFARKGETVELKLADIEIYNLEILEFELPKLKIKINCSKGTYIRSLARD